VGGRATHRSVGANIPEAEGGRKRGGEAEGGAARRFRITNPPLYI
jgi:hypothetical protein